MTDLLCCFRNKKHPIHLNREFRLDLKWWQLFLSSCNGVGVWLFLGMNAISDLEVTSDAADILGYGAYVRGKWFYGSWAPTQAHQSIAYKELFLVVVAAHLWGCRWSKKHVLFRSDNEAVVAIPSARTLECSVLMHLLRDLLLSAARQGFSFSAAHVPGVDNKVANAVSRFRLQGFRRLAPEAQAAPCTVPQFNSFLLEDRYQFFLVHGLTQSTCKSYASGQRWLIEFCRQAGKLHLDGSPCPVEEWTLCLFVSFSCWFHSTCLNQSLSISYPFPSRWTGFSWPNAQLLTPATSYEGN